MHEVGAAWLMTSLAPQPFMVALVPAAANLPVFLLALLAGALADVLDRRRLIICTQSYIFLMAASLAATTQAGLTGPWLLILFTFLLASGTAIIWPAWQAMMPELVPREEVPSAMALGGIGFNLARIVGPMIGGYIVGKAGSWAVFYLNALSYVVAIFALVTWRRAPVEQRLREPLLSAIRAGLRYVRHSPPHRAILLRTAGLISFGGAYWALIALHARQNLGVSSVGYGVLLGWFGAGAVTAGLLVPRLRRSLSADAIITIGAFGAALQMLALAWVRSRLAVDLVMLLGGLSWPLIMISINIAVLHQSPDWVRSRAAAIYLLVFTGTQATASVAWGAVAERIGIPAALVTAGLLTMIAAPLLALIRIPTDDHLDLSPSNHWPAHSGDGDPGHADGPVLVVVQYQIDPNRSAEFADAMAEMRPIRLRNGATRWNLFEDTTSPGRYFESFLVDSWAEHLRQHDRITVTESEVEQRAKSFHIGADPPRVQHFLERA